MSLLRRLPQPVERPGAGLCLSSNDYLGLASHPEVVSAAQEALSRSGCGATGSRLLSGNLSLHEECEAALARFKGTEACLLFNSGYAANLGVLTALAGPGDLLVCDKLNHASLIDGARASGAEARHVPHGRPEAFRARLEKGGYRRRFIVTDGVFSMDGDLAPLPALLALAEDFDATLILDEAHATGVVGPGGRGTLAHYELGSQPRVVQIGTLSKALGGFGAFVACDRPTRELLVNRARSFIYSTALPPAVLGAAKGALALLAREPERVEKLGQNARLMREGLQAAGFEVPDGLTPIIPVLLRDAEQALDYAARLAGLGVQAVRPPTVKRSRLRVTVSATHRQEALEGAIAQFVEARRTVESRP